MGLVTTHVLDTTRGVPAAGIPVVLEDPAGEVLARGRTDDDGRVRDLGPDELAAGVYRLVFDTAGYLGPDGFFPEVAVCFRLTEPVRQHHVPVLLSPFSYSTYRGS